MISHMGLEKSALSAVGLYDQSPDAMDLDRFVTEDEDDEDDAAIQYMIEQSLMESNRQNESRKDERRWVRQKPG